MNLDTRTPPAVVASRVPTAAKLFAMFAFGLALMAVVSFWPPTAAPVIAWLAIWVSVCVATGVAILQRGRFAVALVWTLIGLGIWSAVTAFRSGQLHGVGILIDIGLFVPLVSFAVWYHRSRRARP